MREGVGLYWRGVACEAGDLRIAQYLAELTVCRCARSDVRRWTGRGQASAQTLLHRRRCSARYQTWLHKTADHRRPNSNCNPGEEHTEKHWTTHERTATERLGPEHTPGLDRLSLVFLIKTGVTIYMYIFLYIFWIFVELHNKAKKYFDKNNNNNKKFK